MPPESNYAEATGASWAQHHELAAGTAEILFELYRAVLALGGVKRGRLPKPLKVPRPGAQKPARAPNGRLDGRRHATTPEEVMAVLKAAFPQSKGA